LRYFLTSLYLNKCAAF